MDRSAPDSADARTGLEDMERADDLPVALIPREYGPELTRADFEAGPVVLKNVYADPTVVDYTVTEDLEIGVDVVVEPGVQIGFLNDRAWKMTGDASLDVRGTEDEPVLFRPSFRVTRWRGLELDSDATHHLRHVTLKLGFPSGDDGLLTIRRGTVRADHLVVHNASNIVLYLERGARLVADGPVEVSSAGDTAVSLPVSMVGLLGQLRFRIGARITLRETTGLTTDIMLPALKFDYPRQYQAEYSFPEGLELLGGTFTVGARTTLWFPSGRGIDVRDAATLRILGTAEDAVEMVGAGVTLRGSGRHELRHVTIRNSGTGQPAAIVLGDDDALAPAAPAPTVLEHVSIRGTKTAGVKLYPNANVSSVELHILGAAGPSVEVAQLEQVAMIREGLSTSGGGPIGVQVLQERLRRDFACTERVILNFPHTFTVEPGATLTLGARERIKFAPGAGLVVRGRLVSNGTEERPVQIYGQQQAQGGWLGIHLDSQEPQNLEYLRVAHGGGGLFPDTRGAANIVIGTITRPDVPLTLNNVTLSESGGWGYLTHSTTSPVTYTLSFEENALGDHTTRAE